MQQLAAIQLFASQRALAVAAHAGAHSREMRLDAARRLDVLRRKQEALVARAHEQLLRAGEGLFDEAPLRAVIAHRNPWFVDKVTAALSDSQVQVVARTSNGADAVGASVAEQPDLLLVEDSLEMLNGLEVVREVRQFSPTTTVAVQVGYGDRVGEMLEAGADTVFTRQVPPAEVAEQLLARVSRA
jgi:CheY-like chemotaxis protein